MAKDNQRLTAQTLYIDNCLSAKDIAQKLGVTEKTVGNWVEKGNWKAIRLSKQSSHETMLSRYNELMSLLLDKRLKYEKQQTPKSEEQQAEYRGVLDEMSKLAVLIDKIQVDGKLSLRTHILVLEKFMAALHQQHPKAFMELIDFQKEYFTLLAEELK